MISVENLRLAQGAFRLDGVSFDVPRGAYGVLMGPTGSGKTTVIEAIAGLRSIQSGRIVLGDVDVTSLTPAQRGVGYVPQDNALFRTRTVLQNLSFALELRRIDRTEIARRVDEMAGWLRIEHLLNRFPIGLSGGEAQRVALGRALIFRPPVLLLDEPLSSLDDDTRGSLIELLKSLRDRREVTVLHITHYRSEADALADVRLRIDAGKVALRAP